MGAGHSSLRVNIPAGAKLPPGVIIAWSSEAVPDGWVECDGTNGTDDYRGRFLRGKGAAEVVGATGGDSTHKHTGGAHVHTANSLAIAAHVHTDSLSIAAHAHAGGGSVSDHCHCFVDTCSHTHTTGTIKFPHTHTDDFSLPNHSHGYCAVLGECCNVEQDGSPQSQVIYTDLTGPTNTCSAVSECVLTGCILSCSPELLGTFDAYVISINLETDESSGVCLSGSWGANGPVAPGGSIDAAGITAVAGNSGSGGVVDTTEVSHIPTYTNVKWIMKL